VGNAPPLAITSVCTRNYTTSADANFRQASDGKKMVSFDWVPIRYHNVISILKNPFYAGTYVYGKSEKRSEIVDGRVRKSYGHQEPPQPVGCAT